MTQAAGDDSGYGLVQAAENGIGGGIDRASDGGARQAQRSHSSPDRRSVIVEVTPLTRRLEAEFFGPMGALIDAMLLRRRNADLRLIAEFLRDLRAVMGSHRRRRAIIRELTRSAVLAVAYLIFNEGYSSLREKLAREGIRLGEMLVELAPDAPEAMGVRALMLLTEARHQPRRDTEGALVLLEDQAPEHVESTTDRDRHRPARACDASGTSGPIPVASGDRGSLHRATRRLAQSPSALREACNHGTLTRHRTQPSGGHRDGRGPRSRSGVTRGNRRTSTAPIAPPGLNCSAAFAGTAMPPTPTAKHTISPSLPPSGRICSRV